MEAIAPGTITRRWRLVSSGRTFSTSFIGIVTFALTLYAYGVHAVVPMLIQPPAGCLHCTNDAERVQFTKRELNALWYAVNSRWTPLNGYPAALPVIASFGDAPAAEAPVDGWGRELVYRLESAGMSFTIMSFGADGVPGGDGADADLVMSGARGR